MNHLHKFLSLFISIALFAWLQVENISLLDAARSSGDDPETTEIVVKLNPANGSAIEAINADYGTSTIETLVGSASIYRLGVPSATQAKDVAKQMEDDARLLYAEPNYLSEAPEGNPLHIGAWGGPDDDATTRQYALELLDVPGAHEFRQGAGVVVAILDTGVQLDHPDLDSSWTAARYDFVDDDGDPTDVADGADNDDDGFVDEAFGHGTHIAGIVHLVAPQAQLMPLRVLNADGHGNIFVIAEAVQYALDHGANVINLSLGSAEESDLLEDLLKGAVEQHNVVVIAAAGNLGNNNEQFPASEDDILGVTAIDEQNRKPDFANFGDWIDVVAPGEAITSAFPVSGRASWSGTSMAVPFVAGHAALLRSAVPTMSAVEIAAYIRASAQSVESQNPNFQGQLGAGRIEIGASIRAICDDDGTCQEPDLSGQIVLEARAIVESQPTNGLTGSWVIGGNTYMADSNTEFRQDDGPLAVGTCADIEYRNTSPLTALEIRSREQSKCLEAPTPTPTPTTQPATAPTATPSPTSTSASPTSADTPAPTPTPSPASTSASPTSADTPAPTPTPSPASTSASPTSADTHAPTPTPSPASTSASPTSADTHAPTPTPSPTSTSASPTSADTHAPTPTDTTTALPTGADTPAPTPTDTTTALPTQTATPVPTETEVMPTVVNSTLTTAPEVTPNTTQDPNANSSLERKYYLPVVVVVP